MDGNEFYYKKLFYNSQSESDGVKDFLSVDHKILLRKSVVPQLIKQCYFLKLNNNTDSHYRLLPAEGFYLERIENDPTGQAQVQVGLFGEKTELNTYYCRKSCPQGYYYDFNGISCRRCGFGCSECERFEECDSCIPGFRKYTKPQHSSHAVNESVFSQCQLGCQDGFYLKSFEGTCEECDEDCSHCVDSLFVLKDSFVRGVSPNSYCLRCSDKSNSPIKKTIINITTGKCQISCDSKAKKRDASVMGNQKAVFCHFCERDCLECQIPDTKMCIKCKINYKLIKNGSCIMWYRDPENEIWIFFWVISGAVIAVLVIILIIFLSISQYLKSARFKKCKKNHQIFSKNQQTH